MAGFLRKVGSSGGKGQVKSHTRKTKGGKTITVKAHTRKTKGGASTKKGAGSALRKLFNKKKKESALMTRYNEGNNEHSWYVNSVKEGIEMRENQVSSAKKAIASHKKKIKTTSGSDRARAKRYLKSAREGLKYNLKGLKNEQKNLSMLAAIPKAQRNTKASVAKNRQPKKPRVDSGKLPRYYKGYELPKDKSQRYEAMMEINSGGHK